MDNLTFEIPDIKPPISNPHKWSGWPGAYCIKCGSEDPFENALAMNWLDMDPFAETTMWDSLEHRDSVYKALECAVKK